MPHDPLPAGTQDALVGICVLNYHQPEATVACVASLLAREPATTRILWIENEAAATEAALREALAQAPFPWTELDPGTGSLPPAGTVGLIRCPENLGYGGGNNVGLRFLERQGVPYAWVLNNDTLLVAGSSADLVAASRAQPDVGAWGTPILTERHPPYFGGRVKLRDFAIDLAGTPQALEHPLAFVSGCSLFMPMAAAASVAFLPEDYFLYYEDPSFSLLLKRAGYRIAGLWSVSVLHTESLATGWRSPLMEYYSRRNRWFFIERFFPEHLVRQRRRLAYLVQKYLLRGKLTAVRVELAAFRDYRRGLLGRTTRSFSRAGRS